MNENSKRKSKGIRLPSNVETEIARMCCTTCLTYTITMGINRMEDARRKGKTDDGVMESIALRVTYIDGLHAL